MTPNPDFKDTPLFDVEYLRNDITLHTVEATAPRCDAGARWVCGDMGACGVVGGAESARAMENFVVGLFCDENRWVQIGLRTGVVKCGLCKYIVYLYILPALLHIRFVYHHVTRLQELTNGSTSFPIGDATGGFTPRRELLRPHWWRQVSSGHIRSDGHIRSPPVPTAISSHLRISD